ncbi:MAG: hypothetical protein M1838_005497 [Thelocarpon superellum]|nr:MAG: hypothetical protein M1838_005497 [Thelocarpon superellum]
MPHIEVLPNSASAPAPGWAYVPDTGFDPSKAPIQASGSRQRAARQVAVAGGHEGSVRQHNAILRHLADLDKDNHREVQIPVPVRQRDGAGRASRGKVTPTVRRILGSQKTFANYLADEEALLSTQPQGTGPPTAGGRAGTSTFKAVNPSIARAKRATVTKPARTTPMEGVESAKDPRPPSASETTSQPFPASADASSTSADNADPLLKSYIPVIPPSEVLADLLKTAPLSYAAARAAPPSSAVPPRRFCEICGYWGMVKCTKCGARVCGLECKGVHDEGRCLKFYA